MEPVTNGHLRLPLPLAPTAAPVVTCEGCGICCTEQVIPPFLDEIDFIPRDLQRQIYEARKIEPELIALAKGCLWHDRTTGKCTHYEHRPNVCREFETGSEDCLEIRARLLKL